MLFLCLKAGLSVSLEPFVSPEDEKPRLEVKIDIAPAGNELKFDLIPGPIAPGDMLGLQLVREQIALEKSTPRFFKRRSAKLSLRKTDKAFQLKIRARNKLWSLTAKLDGTWWEHRQELVGFEWRGPWEMRYFTP